jgi:hypothetical protein
MLRALMPAGSCAGVIVGPKEVKSEGAMRADQFSWDGLEILFARTVKFGGSLPHVLPASASGSDRVTVRNRKKQSRGGFMPPSPDLDLVVCSAD